MCPKVQDQQFAAVLRKVQRTILSIDDVLEGGIAKRVSYTEFALLGLCWMLCGYQGSG